jgi:NADPH-dependent curcumin reductase CurA
VGLEVAGLRDRDVVFVSGAAGAVGSVAAQLAKLRGHTVIGSTGSAAKVAYLVDRLGLDDAFSHRDGPIGDSLRRVAPDGIDFYFDNVGGAHLEAAIGALRVHGRVALCGAVSTYNDDAPAPGPANLFLAVSQRLTLRGFAVYDHIREVRDRFYAEVGDRLRTGSIVADETVVDGLGRAPQALIDLLRGEHVGKMLVDLRGDADA